MDEQEYFRRAAGTRIQQNKQTQQVPQEESIKEIESAVTEKSKRGRKKKTETVEQEPIIEEKKIPIYEFGRDDNGEAIIKTQKKEIKGINEQNFEIENNALDRFSNTIQKMIDEEYDKLARCKIEIKILEKMYSLYNKDIYNSQIKSWKDRQFQSITRIRLLNELKENE